MSRDGSDRINGDRINVIVMAPRNTLPETNIAPENRSSQMETCIPTIHFQDHSQKVIGSLGLLKFNGLFKKIIEFMVDFGLQGLIFCYVFSL